MSNLNFRVTAEERMQLQQWGALQLPYDWGYWSGPEREHTAFEARSGSVCRDLQYYTNLLFRNLSNLRDQHMMFHFDTVAMADSATALPLDKERRPAISELLTEFLGSKPTARKALKSLCAVDLSRDEHTPGFVLLVKAAVALTLLAKGDFAKARKEIELWVDDLSDLEPESEPEGEEEDGDDEGDGGEDEEEADGDQALVEAV